MILQTMLQRLFASLVHGPSMNARPHHSRQRCDFLALSAFAGKSPTEGFRQLLKDGTVEFPAKVPRFDEPSYPEAEWSVEQKAAKAAFARQTKLLKKLRDIAEDARDYLNDHGESCLALGFPLISFPPGKDSVGSKASSRVLAPLLLMHIDLKVRTESKPGITISCVGEGADLLVANPSLLAWLERQTGKTLESLFLDEEGANPWSEVEDMLQKLMPIVGLDQPATFNDTTELLAVPELDQLGKGVSILPSAVLGLFPLSNQALLRDTRWMIDHEPQLVDPITSFLNLQALESTSPDYPEPEVQPVPTQRDFSVEWLVTSADPCQASAVLAAREARALVVHGPPGTGKSQTITNMIADHLARGERVLFVCDKRTALDVVKHRLDSLGLGDLCGIVHDPSGDRKQFYMGLREKLDSLADAILPTDPRSELQRVNQQLAAAHGELEGYRRKIHQSPEPQSEAFHELLGHWLELANRPGLPALELDTRLRREMVQSSRTTLDEAARRAQSAGYPSNPFRDLLAVPVSEFLARRAEEITDAFDKIRNAAQAVDAVAAPEFPVLDAAGDVMMQSASFETLAENFQRCSKIAETDAAFTIQVFTQSTHGTASSAGEMGVARAWSEQIGTSPLDPALFASARASGILHLAKVNEGITSLEAWDAVRHSFFKRLFAGKVAAKANEVLQPLGLNANTGFDQGMSFFKRLKPRLLLADYLGRAGGDASGSVSLPEDAVLSGRLQIASLVLDTVQRWKSAGLTDALSADVLHGPKAAELSIQFHTAAKKGVLVSALQSAVHSTGLFQPLASERITQAALVEGAALPVADAWQQALTSLEDMVRFEDASGRLDESMQIQTKLMCVQALPSDIMYAAFLKDAIENELRTRLSGDAVLAAIDNDRIEAAFETLHTLGRQKALLVRDFVRYVWLHSQKARLLAATGSQLNKHGASLRQRLFVRGKKALKLRQMLAAGDEVEGGDPIYDLCPVWMASPATVAQIFPRQSIFSVVIFDEASQCRLEEALPVLLRGQRVVIAGDQKQLPPTRFFESALADSGDNDAETSEELFVQQQSEAEDLLSAALNLDVKEAYLDVHYRSRNENLIGFSNEQYYGSRLQPIPGHPRNKALDTAITLHHVNGVYDDRANVKEAQVAADLVGELLKESAPPSIGLACFNLTQRDAIFDALDAKADADPEFARRLEEARRRKGADSAEGLFVKNLENVQGDERDVMIICTTFGPDKEGKFRRNFGALSQREGGRRLNVLVTRARTAIHVLTSIPPAEYRTIQQPPDGMALNGRLQLYAYLRYAETLAKRFGEYQDALEQMRTHTAAEVTRGESKTPSRVASSLAAVLLEKSGVGSFVHWGNEGFCVDVACIHPLMPADVTVGLMTDFTRFHKTPDPIEWDLFRTNVLRSQGWEIHRIWSPVLFRKKTEVVNRIRQAHERLSVLPSVVESEVKEEKEEEG